MKGWKVVSYSVQYINLEEGENVQKKKLCRRCSIQSMKS